MSEVWADNQFSGEGPRIDRTATAQLDQSGCAGKLNSVDDKVVTAEQMEVQSKMLPFFMVIDIS
jgi:hypothetical protein